MTKGIGVVTDALDNEPFARETLGDWLEDYLNIPSIKSKQTRNQSPIYFGLSFGRGFEMHLIYIDDSKDEQRIVFSGLAFRVESWHETFRAIKAYRQVLKSKYGIAVYYELHATKFVRGKGSLGAKRMVPKGLRCQIFKDTLEFITTLPDVRIFNVSFPLSKEEWAFERLLNRINRTMHTWDSHALLMCDEGRESDYTRLVRRMNVFNPVPSNQGTWGDGSATKNIVIDRIVEDPIFKKSHRSYFIQMADFCAYALLRHDCPTVRARQYGLDKAFTILAKVGVPETAPRDPQHVIRYEKAVPAFLRQRPNLKPGLPPPLKTGSV